MLDQFHNYMVLVHQYQVDLISHYDLNLQFHPQFHPHQSLDPMDLLLIQGPHQIAMFLYNWLGLLLFWFHKLVNYVEYLSTDFHVKCLVQDHQVIRHHHYQSLLGWCYVYSIHHHQLDHHYRNQNLKDVSKSHRKRVMIIYTIFHHHLAIHHRQCHQLAD